MLCISFWSIFQKAFKSNLTLTSTQLKSRTINLAMSYQRFRLTCVILPVITIVSHSKQSILLNIKATMVAGIPCTFRFNHPDVIFTLNPFWEILWSAVHNCLYSIGPVHFMAGNIWLSSALWPHPNFNNIHAHCVFV